MTTNPISDQVSRGDIVTFEPDGINYIYLGYSRFRPYNRRHELFPLIFTTPDDVSRSWFENTFKDILTQKSARKYMPTQKLIKARILDSDELASELSLMEIKACSELGEPPELDVVLDQLLFAECE